MWGTQKSRILRTWCRVTLRLHKMPKDCAPTTFTAEEVKSVTSKTKSSKSIGPDAINMLVLKQLGLTGTKHLTKIFNLSLITLHIPNVWKGRVVLILKPGKPTNLGASSRSITVPFPVEKPLEASPLPALAHHLSLADHQDCFRKIHRTPTVLSVINDSSSIGLVKSSLQG